MTFLTSTSTSSCAGRAMPTIPGSDDEKVMPQQPAEAKPGHTEEDEDPSGDEDIHVEPGVCPCCEQRIGEQDKDSRDKYSGSTSIYLCHF